MGKDGKSRDQARRRQARAQKRSLRHRKRRKEKSHMPRANDIAYIDKEIQRLLDEQKKINQEYQTYHQEVTEAIREVLVDADVYDEVRGMETEREQARGKAQAKIDNLAARINALSQSRDFLMQRDREDPETEPVKEAPSGDVEETSDVPESEEITAPENEEDPPEKESVPEDISAPEDVSPPVKVSAPEKKDTPARKGRKRRRPRAPKF